MRRMLPIMRRFSPRDDPEPAPDPEPEQFYPSLRDVFQVRAILRRGIVPGGLPVEIVDLIVDAAEYWPSVEARIREKIVIRQDGDRECLRTPPLCYEQTPTDASQPRILPHRGMHPCRKIVFSIASHDQGWGGGLGNKGKHVGAYSWFDAFIVPAARNPDDDDDDDAETKPDESRLEPFLPTANRLQTNPVATGTTQNFRIVWHYRDAIPADSAAAEEIEREEGRGRATLDGSAVRNMRVGDAVSVWARARFAGWANHVERLSVRVFWAV
ncbi:hypothetical protein VTN02DRAFT_6766 [Thermoascus thermophilus]